MAIRSSWHHHWLHHVQNWRGGGSWYPATGGCSSIIGSISHRIKKHADQSWLHSHTSKSTGFGIPTQSLHHLQLCSIDNHCLDQPLIGHLHVLLGQPQPIPGMFEPCPRNLSELVSCSSSGAIYTVTVSTRTICSKINKGFGNISGHVFKPSNILISSNWWLELFTLSLWIYSHSSRVDTKHGNILVFLHRDVWPLQSFFHLHIPNQSPSLCGSSLHQVPGPATSSIISHCWLDCSIQVLSRTRRCGILSLLAATVLQAVAIHEADFPDNLHAVSYICLGSHCLATLDLQQFCQRKLLFCNKSSLLICTNISNHRPFVWTCQARILP